VGVLPPSTSLPLSLRLLDPIVGCWLLQSDHPVSSFLGCVKIILPSKIVSNPGSDQTAATHREMDLLADLSRELFRLLEKVNLWSLFYQLEMRILPVLVSMERRGVCVDNSRLEDLGRVLGKQLEELQEKANEMAGKVFNLSSPKQVRTVLYEELKLDLKAGTMVGKTAGGVKSTCEAVLAKLVTCHPLPAIILQHRHLAKYKTTYVEGILGHCKMGKVFTIWDQVAAATGRVTSVSPNLEAIPKGDLDIGSKTINLRSPIRPTQRQGLPAAALMRTAAVIP
jgi:DNA polymerase I-like protein with 3'-5' exonuclease and polymerase domains